MLTAIIDGGLHLFNGPQPLMMAVNIKLCCSKPLMMAANHNKSIEKILFSFVRSRGSSSLCMTWPDVTQKHIKKSYLIENPNIHIRI